jgi:hypothetical protein
MELTSGMQFPMMGIFKSRCQSRKPFTDIHHLLYENSCDTFLQSASAQEAGSGLLP